MRVVPEPLAEKITFFQTHLGKFEQNAVAIGTTPEAVADLEAKTEAARAAFAEASVARMQARTATLKMKNAIEAMETAGAAIIQQVRARASMVGDEVYPLASIPKPGKGSPVGAPGTPYQLETDLRGNGALGLRWRCKNPAGCYGVMYQISRSVGRDGTFAYLASTGKRLVDETLPAGATYVAYRIQGVRSTSAGNTAEFPVTIGKTPGSMLPPSLQMAA